MKQTLFNQLLAQKASKGTTYREGLIFVKSDTKVEILTVKDLAQADNWRLATKERTK